MAFAEKISEQQHVDRRNQAMQSKFASRRTRSIIAAIAAAIIAVVFFCFARWTLSVSALFVSVIALSTYFTANGHMHYIQKRGKTHRRLSRDFSKLDRNNREPSESVASPRP